MKKNKMSRYSNPLIGAIDFVSTKIASALFSPPGRPLFRSRVPAAPNGVLAVLDEVVSLYYQLEAESGKKSLAGK